MPRTLYTKIDNTTKSESEARFGINWDNLVDDTGDGLNFEIEEKPKRRGRPRKQNPDANSTSTVRYSPNVNSDEMLKTNQPYNTLYTETQNLLKNTVYQIDVVTSDIKEQIDAIKASKTIRGKYKYLSDLASSQSSLLNAKIAAIREMNKTLTDTNNLELKRASTLKMDNEVDDDKRIMDLYNAFIKTPISSGQLPTGYSSPLGPGIMDMTMPNTNINIYRNDIQGDTSDDYGYQQYMNNLTPEQKRMHLENDPNIQTVVVYNQETGERRFDVIDIRTGQSIPGVATPDPFLLENMSINLRSGTARNSDANLDFGLVVIGNPGSINDF